MASPIASGHPSANRAASTAAHASSSPSAYAAARGGDTARISGVSAVTSRYAPRNHSSCVVSTMSGRATSVGASTVTTAAIEHMTIR